MKTIILVLLVGFLLPLGLSAQTGERVLLPIMSAETPGAYGSLWRTALWIHNVGERLLDIGLTRHPECVARVGGVCEAVPIAPGGTAWVIASKTNPPGEPPGVFLNTPPGQMDQARFNLRVQDVSRQDLTWGTQIPVVRERDVTSGQLVIMNVPYAKRFRAALRVYDFDATPFSQVRVRYEAIDKRFGSSPGIPLREEVLTLTSPVENGQPGRPLRPGYAQVLDLYPGLPDMFVYDGVHTQALEQFRITVEPLTPGLRYWGYVSVVNNETQHLTVIAPN